MRNIIAMTAVVLISGSVATGWNDYDPCDFAVEVISYTEGTDVGWEWWWIDPTIPIIPYSDPCTALGRPTAMTTGDERNMPVDEDVPVVPIYPAFRAFELVTIGNWGQLALKFNHRVSDDENNAYGIDLIVFGNSAQNKITLGYWANGNPENFYVSGSIEREPAVVSVSQDGETWHTFENGPYGDDFAPTAGYEWDDVNDVWAEELNPTQPVDPELTPGDLAGMSVAEMIETYDGSAGGTGFDIGELGLDWIQYVRISDNPDSTKTSEVDAVADVSCCGDYRHPYPPGDVTGDCWVDEDDLLALVGDWTVEGDCEHGGEAPKGDADGNCRADLNDFRMMAANWLVHTWQWD